MIRRIALLAFTAAAFAACTPKPEEPAEPAAFTPVPISPFMGETVLGDPNAPVEIVEYASTTCGHCKAFHEGTLPEVKAAYIDTGKAKLVYRVVPTEPGAIAVAGASIARCAGEDKFFDVIGDLFENQETLVMAGSEAVAREELGKVGARHGLTPDEVRTCIDSDEVIQVTIDQAQNAPAEVTGTPTIFVAGQKIEEYSFENLSAAIEAQLAAQTQ
jgi:protein-disulfide isomerase